MLLRRIKAHIKKENWLAVFIDFLIVVVGILIAFQITNWNDHRLELQRESEILERLTEDFLQIKAETDEAVSYSESQQKFLTELVTDLTLDPERLFEGNRIEMFRQNLNRIAAVRTSLTYRQLVNSGDLSLITSESLRVALDEYERQARGHRDAENWSTAMTSGPNVKATRFAFLISLDEENAAVSDVISSRLRAHLQDPEVIDSMWSTKLILGSNLYWHQQVLASVETVLDQLNSLCAVRCKNTEEKPQ